jgi:molybdopterin-guanine dinucleotide biosynthesis protein A
MLVVATDLLLLTVDLLRWLAEHPSVRSVVPTVDGRSLALCARYNGADLSVAGQLVKHDRRAMRDLVDAVVPALIESSGQAALYDIDTSEDLASLPKQAKVAIL